MSSLVNDGHVRKWWKEGTAYQIYPASFKDANGDGVGDLAGIISELDYVKDLGINIIWISPHFASPQVDMGYDISDYQGIYPPYGTAEECDQLIEEVHKRGMKIIFDLVINHSSDQHEWFKESRSSRDNPKRDWYIWRPAKYDKAGKRHPPNNWQSNFTIPAWTWDEITQEYYLHLFASEQPDLNWENQECRKEIYNNAIKYWLDKGVDGFRIDVVNMYSKPYVYNEETKIWDLPNAPITKPEQEYQPASMLYCNGPRMEEFLHEISDILDQYDCMTVGEAPSTPLLKDVVKYISAKERQLNMIFNFNVAVLGTARGNRFELTPFSKEDFKREITRWQHVLNGSDAWTTVFLENHDQPRSVSRFGSDLPQYRELSAKMLATIQTTLTGTLFLYQGQEIGMTNAPRSWPPENYKCIKSVNYYQDLDKQTKGSKVVLDQALDGMHAMARDHARVPMQWDDSPNAGFSPASAKPWMSVLDNYEEINVAAQTRNQDSVLNFWKQLLTLRKQQKDLFVYGIFKMAEETGDVLIFTKESGGKKSLTVANLTADRQEWRVPAWFDADGMQLLIGNYKGESEKLEPFEARVYIQK